MHAGVIAIIGVTLVAVTSVTNESPQAAISNALSSYSSPLIWPISIAVMMSRGLITTGLGCRITYYFISVFGKRTIGVAYSLTAPELMITPSITARGGRIIHPIMKSIAQSLHSTPEEGTQKNIGAI